MVPVALHGVLAADAAGVSPALTTIGLVVSILASIATVLTVVIMFRTERNNQKIRDVEAEARQEERLRLYNQFRTDFYGDHREGVPAKPGVLEWMQGIDKILQQIHHETTPNGGGSMKDAIHRIDLRLENVETEVRNLHQAAP